MKWHQFTWLSVSLVQDIHIRFWDAQTIFHEGKKHPRTIPTRAVPCVLASEKLYSIFVWNINFNICPMNSRTLPYPYSDAISIQFNSIWNICKIYSISSGSAPTIHFVTRFILWILVHEIHNKLLFIAHTCVINTTHYTVVLVPVSIVVCRKSTVLSLAEQRFEY